MSRMGDPQVQAISTPMDKVTTPLVSILIAAHQAERFVAETLESALNQTWPATEIVVVDDGSTDETADILAAYAARHPSLRVVTQSNAGQSAALNHAFRLSRGSYVKFLDADDLLSPSCIELQMKRLLSSPRAIAAAEWGRFYSDAMSARFLPEDQFAEDLDGVSWLVRAWCAGGGMSQCGMFLIPRSVLQLSGLWNAQLAQGNDFEFFTRVMLACECVLFTPNARLYYRSGNPTSMSHSVSRSAAECFFLAFTLGAEYLRTVEDSPRTRKACASMFQQFVYRHYPNHLDLVHLMERRVRVLGGTSLPPDGPPLFQLLRRVIGWRPARRIEQLAVRQGLNRRGIKNRLRRARNGRDNGVSRPDTIGVKA